MLPRGKYIVAVSGGVDSVVLLDMIVKEGQAPLEIIIAHFDHGIRPESADDATFVGELAKKYGLVYETAREELGADASEEMAREHRYAFLRALTKKYRAKIITAHHADDVVETIAINLTRGTGWRGLAVLDSPDIERPILHMRKSELVAYAKKYKLNWREDATNKDTSYLRNDIRERLTGIDDDTVRLLGLYRTRQLALKKHIDGETVKIISNSPYSRYLFITTPEFVAVELLRAVFMKEAKKNPTIPQRGQALHAIKTYHSGKQYEVAEGLTLVFTKTEFIVQSKTEML